MTAVYITAKPRNRVDVLRVVKAALASLHPKPDAPKRHCHAGDPARSRRARLTAKERRAARELKGRYVPLYKVPAPERLITTLGGGNY